MPTENIFICGAAGFHNGSFDTVWRDVDLVYNRASQVSAQGVDGEMEVHIWAANPINRPTDTSFNTTVANPSIVLYSLDAEASTAA